MTSLRHKFTIQRINWQVLLVPLFSYSFKPKLFFNFLSKLITFNLDPDLDPNWAKIQCIWIHNTAKQSGKDDSPAWWTRPARRGTWTRGSRRDEHRPSHQPLCACPTGSGSPEYNDKKMNIRVAKNHLQTRVKKFVHRYQEKRTHNKEIKIFTVLSQENKSSDN